MLEHASKFHLDQHWQTISGDRAFFYFCGMQHLLNAICPQSEWKNRFKEHIDNFSKITVNTASLKDFGLTLDLKNWALWR